MAVLGLEWLGIPRFHRQGRHGDRLAPEWLWPVLLQMARAVRRRRVRRAGLRGDAED